MKLKAKPSAKQQQEQQKKKKAAPKAEGKGAKSPLPGGAGRGEGAAMAAQAKGQQQQQQQGNPNLRSTGMKFGIKKLVLEYLEARPGLEAVQRQIDSYMQGYEATQQKRREELAARAAAEQAEEGWTVVLPRASRELGGAEEEDGPTPAAPTPPTPGGNATASQAGTRKAPPVGGKRSAGERLPGAQAQGGNWNGVAGAAAQQGSAQHEGAKGKRKAAARVSDDFYRFQSKDARRNELLDLQTKFEEDKKRVAQAREARKFKPY